MLTDALKVMINNSFKKKIYGKRKKINILIAFLFPIKIVSKLS